ncbi:MAG: SusC/RagA family TonB-linked outer membrane protein [Flavobacterium sp.]|nr:SusC/RagA family TonB-linked outer membrane protein [Flavobacterium sp.]
MKKKYLILLLFFAGIIATYSQDITVKGKVTDSDGISLPGVNILVKGTNVSTVTGMDGDFSFKAQSGAVLVISFIGFETKEVKVTGSSLNIILNEGSQSLKEVVIVGSLGRTLDKSSLGYSTQSIKGKEIAETQRPNFANAMQGRVAGLTVTSTSGAPGASTAIQLRGVNSISGSNTPLYIVDGLPVSNQTLSQGSLISDAANRNQDYTNRGADINPDDIETITILKGPEAAALYGIEAGNGAIVITTKKGRKGLGSITYTSNTRFEQIYRFPETQNVYQRGSSGLNATTGTAAFGTMYAPGTKFYDNVGDFFKTGISNQHNLSFDAGNENMTYRISFANLDQTGVVPNTDYNRLNLSLNSTAKINDKLKSEAIFSYTKTSNKKASKGAGSYLTNLLNWPVNDNASNYLTSNGAGGFTRRRITDASVAAEFDNPYWDIYKNPAEDFNNRFVANVGLVYDPTSWLNITGRAGYDVIAGRGYRAIHPDSNAGLSGGGFIESYYNNATVFNSNILVTAKHSFGKFNTKLLVGNGYNDSYQSIISTQGNKFILKDFYSINNTDPSTQRSQERLIQKRVIGLFSEASIDYDKIVYLTLTGRNDWSSTLPKGNNSFFYPSISTSFVFTNLGSLKDGNILSFGKLRASWANVGKDATPYVTEAAFESKPITGGGFGYGFFGPNTALKPEFRISYEFGTELKFFKDRIGLDVAVYSSRTVDPIVANLRSSYGGGFVLSNVNFGELLNEGLEITLNAKIIKSENFDWDFTTNFTKTRSEVVDLEVPEYYLSDTWVVGNVRGGLSKGYPITTITGMPYATNTAGEVLIDGSGYPIKAAAEKNSVVGDRNPDFMLGLQNSFSYKNWSLSFLLDIRKGGDVFNGVEYNLRTTGYSINTLDRETPLVVKGVLKDGLENSATPTVNNIQITPYYQNGYYGSGYNEIDFIEKDVNWIRMRDITLSYRLPSEIIRKSKIFNSLAFNFTVTDAFLITNYSGADPSVNGTNASTGGAGGVGFDLGTLSTPRGYNFSVKIGL